MSEISHGSAGAKTTDLFGNSENKMSPPGAKESEELKLKLKMLRDENVKLNEALKST